MEEDYSDHNRVAGWMKLKMHSKISPNSYRRGGEKWRKSKWGRKRTRPSFENDNIVVSDYDVVFLFKV